MKKSFSAIALITVLLFAVPSFAGHGGHNTNFKTNTNIQNQYQSQSQKQINNASITGSSADANADAGAALNQGDINSGNTSVGAPIPGSVPGAPLINYFGKALPSSGFQPVEQLIMYGCWFSEGALDSMLKKVEDVDAEFKVVNMGLEPAAPAMEDGKTRWIKVVISRTKYANAADYVGNVTSRSEDENTTMTEVMAKAAKEAMDNGCNVVHFTSQGAVRDAFSDGWSLGFASTQAQVYDNLDKSNVSIGGFGYASAEAGMRDKPWLQGFGLIDRSLTYPNLRMVQKVEKNQVILNNVKSENTTKLAPVKTVKTDPTDSNTAPVKKLSTFKSNVLNYNPNM